MIPFDFQCPTRIVFGPGKLDELGPLASGLSLATPRPNPAAGGATVFASHLGTASAVAPSPYTSYIGDTLRFVGNGDLVINNDTSLTALPLPTSLYVQTGGRPILSQ